MLASDGGAPPRDVLRLALRPGGGFGRGAKPPSELAKEGAMGARVNRREFLKTTAAATAGVAWLAGGRAPAFAQKRELHFLSTNHFGPASDDELRPQADV